MGRGTHLVTSVEVTNLYLMASFCICILRTGMLHLGDKLVALNGRKMACVEEAIALIDAIPMGEIVSVTVHKEEEVEGRLQQDHREQLWMYIMDARGKLGEKSKLSQLLSSAYITKP